MAALVEVLARLQVLREVHLDNAPEALRVVHLEQVRQFVHHDVVDDVLRCLNQPPAQPDLPLVVTAAPLGARIGHMQPGCVELHRRSIVRDTPAEVLHGVAAVPADGCLADTRLATGIGNGDVQIVGCAEQWRHQDGAGDNGEPEFAAEKGDVFAIGPALLACLVAGPFVEFFQDPVGSF